MHRDNHSDIFQLIHICNREHVDTMMAAVLADFGLRASRPAHGTGHKALQLTGYFGGTRISALRPRANEFIPASQP
jgi:hypothetical protein